MSGQMASPPTGNSQVKDPASRARFFGSLARNVFLLGLVSFFTDMSSEMTLTILPLFLANVLGSSTAAIGLIEGIAETTASLTKIFSGWFSDRLGKRKALTTVGYTLSALSKPLLYFAGTWGTVLGVRFADRLGKGIRTSPRDALIADSVPPDQRGISFGFHRAADSAGAFLGLSLAAAIIFFTQRFDWQLTRGAYQLLVLVGVIPAFLAVGILAFLVKEPNAAQRKPDSHKPGAPSPTVKAPTLSLKGFDLRFKLLLFIMVLFTLGNSSDAFLILRAQNLGLSALEVVLLLVVFNLVYTLVSTPAGALSDRLGRKRLITAGWTVYSLIYLGFALASETWHVWLLFAAYGAYYALAEGAGKALVADFVPPEKRGTAYGLYHAAIGLAAFPASLIAGILWQGAGTWAGLGPSAPFYFGAVLAVVAALLLRITINEEPLGKVK